MDKKVQDSVIAKQEKAARQQELLEKRDRPVRSIIFQEAVLGSREKKSIRNRF